MGTHNVKIKTVALLYQSNCWLLFLSYVNIMETMEWLLPLMYAGYGHLSYSFTDCIWEEKGPCTSKKHWRSVRTYFGKHRVQVSSGNIQGQLYFLFQVVLLTVLKTPTTPLTKATHTEQHTTELSNTHKIHLSSVHVALEFAQNANHKTCTFPAPDKRFPLQSAQKPVSCKWMASLHLSFLLPT